MARLVSCFRHSRASSFERAVSARGPVSAGAACATATGVTETTGAGAPRAAVAGMMVAGLAAAAASAGFAAGASPAFAISCFIASCFAGSAFVISSAGFAAAGAVAGLSLAAGIGGLAAGGFLTITCGGGGGAPMNISQDSQPATPKTAIPAAAMPAFFLSIFIAIAISLSNPLSEFKDTAKPEHVLLNARRAAPLPCVRRPRPSVRPSAPECLPPPPAHPAVPCRKDDRCR